MFKMKTRKAQISATITWFVAFLIIFFIIMIFLFFTLIASRNKDIDIETVKYNSESLESQRFLTSFLKQETEDGTMKETIRLWVNGNKDGFEEIFNEKFQEFYSDYDFECYILRVESGSREIDIKSLEGYGGRWRSLSTQSSFLEKGAQLILVPEKDAEIKFYGGDCNL